MPILTDILNSHKEWLNLRGSFQSRAHVHLNQLDNAFAVQTSLIFEGSISGIRSALCGFGPGLRGAVRPAWGYDDWGFFRLTSSHRTAKYFPWEVVKLLWWRVALYLLALALVLTLWVIYVPLNFFWLILLGLSCVVSPPFVFWTFVFIIEPYRRVVFPDQVAEEDRKHAEEKAEIEEELENWRRRISREEAGRLGEIPDFEAESDWEQTEYVPPIPEPVDPPYTPEELKVLYRTAARKYHPDQAIDDSDYARRDRLMKEVNLAYEEEDGFELERLVNQAPQ